MDLAAASMISTVNCFTLLPSINVYVSHISSSSLYKLDVNYHINLAYITLSVKYKSI